MPTIEQQLVTLQAQNSALVSASNALTGEVTGKMAAIDARVGTKEGEVDSFLQDATPETRYVQDITIGGSADYLYPVWWNFQSSAAGVSKVSVCRNYVWNGEVGARPLNPGSSTQAGLIFEVEGCDTPWGGDPDIMEIKRFIYTYNPLLSHSSYRMFCEAEAVPGASAVVYAGIQPNTFGAHCATHSGIYLRGGGLTYRIIKNWLGDISFHDGSDMLQRQISSVQSSSWSVRWYATPLPMSSIVEPALKNDAFVNP